VVGVQGEVFGIFGGPLVRVTAETVCAPAGMTGRVTRATTTANRIANIISSFFLSTDHKCPV